MNTFLPYADFEESARILDDRRLGKQRVEAMQIINVLMAIAATSASNTPGKKIAWRNHPAVKMWHGHIDLLKCYCNAMITEWIRRGKNNTMKLYTDVPPVPTQIATRPWWLGWAPFHDSHRASLLRKDPKFYGERLQLTQPGYAEWGYTWPHRLDPALRQEPPDQWTPERCCCPVTVTKSSARTRRT